jgi:hypothetical protein
MAIKNIHDAANPRKSRVHNIKTFRDRDEWLEMLLGDNEVSLGAKVAGSRIALHHNVETRQCNPKIETLVDGTRISQSSVRRHVAELEAAGWLRVDRTVGRYSNSYELRVPTLSAVTGLNPVNCERVDEPNPVTGERVQNAPTLSTVTPQPCQNQPNPVTHERSRTANLRTAKRTAKEIDSPALDLGEKEDGRRQVDHSSSAPDSSDTDACFVEFYAKYPKRVARAAAEKAYRGAMKKGATPAEIFAGAMRAAEAYQLDAQRRGPETAHQFAKNPATWLNGGCWDDDPVPSGAAYGAPTQAESPHIARGKRIALQLMEKQLMEKGGDHVQ